jgi:hypothetical protein
MTQDFLDRDRAAKLFVERIISHARKSVIKGVQDLFENGPPGRAPRQSDVDLHNWYLSLDRSSQDYVYKVIHESVDTALFSVFVVLDGAVVGRPLRDQVSEFALFLKAYESWEAQKAGKPLHSIKISPSDGADLHDMFMWAVEEMDSR